MIVRSRPLWLPAMLVFSLVPLFAGLGVWQLHRAEVKQVLRDQYDQRVAAAPMRLGPSLGPAQALQFRRLSARGQFDPTYQILVDNRVHKGRAGYHVLTPLKLDGGDTRVLVNRGWVPLGASRRQLPPVDAPTGIQDISGVAVVPAEKVFSLGAEPAPERGWQPVWPHLDMRRYAAAVPFAVQPIVILLDADVPGGFIREWARPDTGILMHQGYAFQWFSLAALAAAIFAVMVWRIGRRRNEGVA